MQETSGAFWRFALTVILASLATIWAWAASGCLKIQDWSMFWTFILLTHVAALAVTWVVWASSRIR